MDMIKFIKDISAKKKYHHMIEIFCNNELEPVRSTFEFVEKRIGDYTFIARVNENAVFQPDIFIEKHGNTLFNKKFNEHTFEYEENVFDNDNSKEYLDEIKNIYPEVIQLQMEQEKKRHNRIGRRGFKKSY